MAGKAPFHRPFHGGAASFSPAWAGCKNRGLLLRYASFMPPSASIKGLGPRSRDEAPKPAMTVAASIRPKQGKREEPFPRPPVGSSDLLRAAGGASPPSDREGKPSPDQAPRQGEVHHLWGGADHEDGDERRHDGGGNSEDERREHVDSRERDTTGVWERNSVREQKKRGRIRGEDRRIRRGTDAPLSDARSSSSPLPPGAAPSAALPAVGR